MIAAPLDASETEATEAARTLIDARLAGLTTGELVNFWQLVAKLYSRGVDYPTADSGSPVLPAVLAAKILTGHQPEAAP